MNIKQIVDKIVVEADVNPSEYTVQNRIDDVNEYYLSMIEKARQIASKEPISDGEAVSETFNIIQGDQTLTRTIPDVSIFRVDFKPSGSSRYCRLDEDQGRSIASWCWCGMRFFADEKRVFIENGRAGTIRVTYAGGAITQFTAADYSDPTPPSPSYIPEAFHPLLWLEPATVQAEYYKKDRVVSLRARRDKLRDLFDSHYKRNAVQNARFSKETDGQHGDNYR